MPLWAATETCRHKMSDEPMSRYDSMNTIVFESNAEGHRPVNSV